MSEMNYFYFKKGKTLLCVRVLDDIFSTVSAPCRAEFEPSRWRISWPEVVQFIYARTFFMGNSMYGWGRGSKIF